MNSLERGAPRWLSGPLAHVALFAGAMLVVVSCAKDVVLGEHVGRSAGTNPDTSQDTSQHTSQDTVGGSSAVTSTADSRDTDLSSTDERSYDRAPDGGWPRGSDGRPHWRFDAGLPDFDGGWPIDVAPRPPEHPNADPGRFEPPELTSTADGTSSG